VAANRVDDRLRLAVEPRTGDPDHAMLLRRRPSKRSMPNPLTLVTHRVTKVRGFVVSPLHEGREGAGSV
jgi:hypothetical protein